MNKDTDIIIVGDVHARFGELNSFINKKKPKIILSVGDFGYWPNSPHWTYIKTQGAKLHWCDGNHEDFVRLNNRSSNEVQKNVFYQPRGSTITLPDGRIVLFMGGAWSIDWQYRTDWIDWFKDYELINTKDVDKALENKHVDIVISHTAPIEFDLGVPGEKDNDFSRKALSHILNELKPSGWYFGHWHTYRNKVYTYDDGKICNWTCLDMLGHNNWWCYLDDR